jgi:hypothetical protein
VLPGKVAKEHRDTAAFFCREGSFDRAVEVDRRVNSGNLPQPLSLGLQSRLDSESFSIWTKFVATKSSAV